MPCVCALPRSYNGLAVGALSNFATWQVMQLEQQLRDFVASASA